MVTLLEKVKHKEKSFSGRLYYDISVLEKRFKLPSKPTFFLHELFLLSFFCLRSKRFRQVTSVFFKLMKQNRRDAVNHLSTKAELLLQGFIDLGSTFIKIGQFLSTRSDILSKEYVEALSELQDSLPPMLYSEVKSIVERELRKPIDCVFKLFNEEPIASASIGQVHKALLISGLNVVVKVQRPNLSELFYEDLAIIRCIATFLERYTKIGKEREWVQIVDEIGKTLFEEIDFIQEGKNADHLRRNLHYEERVYIPKIFWQYTTRKLITIEFVPGIKITDIESLKENNIDAKDLALVLTHAYFKQVFEDGFFHADPHPGNIVVKEDGTIVFYDFGMVGRINENIRAELANVLLSIVGNDTSTLLNTLKKLELLKQNVDVEPIKRVVENVLYKYYDGGKLKDLDLDGLEDDLKMLFKDKPMKLPSKFTYTLRATGALEGVCRTLDPDFSLVKAATPYFQDWLTDKPQGSAWTYLKAAFPTHSKLIDKIKVYLEVLKDLPKYVGELEHKDVETLQRSVSTEANFENEHLKEEVKNTNSKLKVAYSVIFLLSFVFIGNYLVQAENFVISTLGFVLLISSVFGSIGIVVWSIFRVGERK